MDFQKNIDLNIKKYEEELRKNNNKKTTNNENNNNNLKWLIKKMNNLK